MRHYLEDGFELVGDPVGDEHDSLVAAGASLDLASPNNMEK